LSERRAGGSVFFAVVTIIQRTSLVGGYGSAVAAQDPTLWSYVYLFDWRSVLSFTRRKGDLLDYLEAHVEPTAFTETDDSVGVELGMTHRIVVRRDGMTVELLGPGSEPESMATVLDGVFEAIRPNLAIPHAYYASWSLEVDGDYEDRRRGLAERATNFPEDSGVRAADIAILTDVESSEGSGQIEFGIVTAPELRLRLEKPRMGRSPAAARQLPPVRNIPGTLPLVSLFAQTTWARSEVSVIESAGSVTDALSAARSDCARLIRALGAGL
jgi:hypothetical protein